MTEETMIMHIRELNKGNDEYIDHIKEISPTVELIKLWDIPFEKLLVSTSVRFPSTVYFIKEDNGLYVGGVQDGGNDLHWVMLPEFRKIGYLTKAMKEFILPHIFLNRRILRITIDGGSIGKENFTASTKVAIALGFTELFHRDHISKFELKAEEFDLLNK